VDCDPTAQTTYEKNNVNLDGSPAKFILSRVEDLDVTVTRDILAPFRNRPAVFVGCPPCQPFTKLRTDKHRSLETKAALTHFVSHVQAIVPEYVVVENVPGISAAKYGTVWSDALDRLNTAGYTVRTEVVDARSFGVPQTRRRMILVAVKNGEPPWPEATHENGNHVTVRDALKGARLVPLRAGQTSKSDNCHVAAALSPLNLQRILATPKSGGSRTAWPRELQLPCYHDHDGHTDVYGRMAWDRPAPTLTTRFVSISNGRFGHPTQPRAITPREGALLQTFPAWYSFEAKSRDTNVMHIGNAVPPLLAEAFMRSIILHATNSKGNC
jgi:DNA (cytosine-5)-methyltransferase 1